MDFVWRILSGTVFGVESLLSPLSSSSSSGGLVDTHQSSILSSGNPQENESSCAGDSSLGLKIGLGISIPLLILWLIGWVSSCFCYQNERVDRSDHRPISTFRNWKVWGVFILIVLDTIQLSAFVFILPLDWDGNGSILRNIFLGFLLTFQGTKAFHYTYWIFVALVLVFSLFLLNNVRCINYLKERTALVEYFFSVLSILVFFQLTMSISCTYASNSGSDQLSNSEKQCPCYPCLDSLPQLQCWATEQSVMAGFAFPCLILYYVTTFVYMPQSYADPEAVVRTDTRYIVSYTHLKIFLAVLVPNFNQTPTYIPFVIGILLLVQLVMLFIQLYFHAFNNYNINYVRVIGLLISCWTSVGGIVAYVVDNQHISTPFIVLISGYAGILFISILIWALYFRHRVPDALSRAVGGVGILPDIPNSGYLKYTEEYVRPLNAVTPRAGTGARGGFPVKPSSASVNHLVEALVKQKRDQSSDVDSMRVSLLRDSAVSSSSSQAEDQNSSPDSLYSASSGIQRNNSATSRRGLHPLAVPNINIPVRVVGSTDSRGSAPSSYSSTPRSSAGSANYRVF